MIWFLALLMTHDLFFTEAYDDDDFMGLRSRWVSFVHGPVCAIAETCFTCFSEPFSLSASLFLPLLAACCTELERGVGVWLQTQTRS